MNSFRFDIAFSFAGSHRVVVKAVAEELGRRLGNGKVFYDDWFAHEILGPDMDQELGRIYNELTLLVVADLSEDYADRPWCQAEWRAIRSLRMTLDSARDETSRLRLITLRFADGEVPGVFATEGYFDARGRPTGEIADFLAKRLHLLHARLAGTTTAELDHPLLVDAIKPEKKHWRHRVWIIAIAAVMLGAAVLWLKPLIWPPPVVKQTGPIIKPGFYDWSHVKRPNGTHDSGIVFRFTNSGDDAGWVGTAQFILDGDGIEIEDNVFPLIPETTDGVPPGPKWFKMPFQLQNSALFNDTVGKHCLALRSGSLKLTASIWYSGPHGTKVQYSHQQKLMDFYYGVWPRSCLP